MKKKVGVCFVAAVTFGIACSLGVSSDATEKIRLNRKQVYLQKGQKFKLKLKGVKSKKVKWSSNNRKVATVKNGVISTKKAGKCTVIAKYEKKKYKCVVNVERKGTDAANESSTPALETALPDSTQTSETSAPSSTPTAEPTVVQVPGGGTTPDYSFSVISDFSSVPMEVQTDLSDQNMLTVKVSNCSGTDITMDKYFTLEFLEGDKWTSVKCREDAVFEEVLLLVKNGADYVQKIDLKQYFEGLSKGQYRISKRIASANEGTVSAYFVMD